MVDLFHNINDRLLTSNFPDFSIKETDPLRIIQRQLEGYSQAQIFFDNVFRNTPLNIRERTDEDILKKDVQTNIAPILLTYIKDNKSQYITIDEFAAGSEITFEDVKTGDTVRYIGGKVQNNQITGNYIEPFSFGGRLLGIDALERFEILRELSQKNIPVKFTYQARVIRDQDDISTESIEQIEEYIGIIRKFKRTHYEPTDITFEIDISPHDDLQQIDIKKTTRFVEITQIIEQIQNDNSENNTDDSTGSGDQPDTSAKIGKSNKVVSYQQMTQSEQPTEYNNNLAQQGNAEVIKYGTKYSNVIDKDNIGKPGGITQEEYDEIKNKKLYATVLKPTDDTTVDKLDIKAPYKCKIVTREDSKFGYSVYMVSTEDPRHAKIIGNLTEEEYNRVSTKTNGKEFKYGEKVFEKSFTGTNKVEVVDIIHEDYITGAGITVSPVSQFTPSNYQTISPKNITKSTVTKEQEKSVREVIGSNVYSDYRETIDQLSYLKDKTQSTGNFISDNIPLFANPEQQSDPNLIDKIIRNDIQSIGNDILDNTPEFINLNKRYDIDISPNLINKISKTHPDVIKQKKQTQNTTNKVLKEYPL